MSDTVTRELERAASTGNLDDGVRALAARARRGSELLVACSSDWVASVLASLEASGRYKHPPGCKCYGTGRVEWPYYGNAGRLALAAYAGDEAARVLVGWPPPGESAGQDAWRELVRIGASIDPDCLSLDDWASVLSRWPRETLVRAARAAAGAWHAHQCPCGTRAPAIGHYPQCWMFRQALKAVDAWLADPTDANRDACVQAGEPQDPARMLAFYVGCGWRMPSQKNTGAHQFELSHVIAEAARPAGEQPVRAAIQSALVEWAVGS